MTDYDWPTDRTERLRALWDEGLSASEIGRRLGVSKNAVLGKVHRLHLPPRPSPIKLGPGVPRRKMERKPPRQARVARAPEPAPPPPEPMPTQTSRFTCQWPVATTHHERPRYLFCGAPAVPGAWQPYCAHHRARSTVRGSVLTAEALAA